MKRRRIGFTAAGVLALALAAAGCRDDLTQVVLVLQSDLLVPTEVDGMDLTAIEGPFAPPVSPFFSFGGTSLAPFPLSVGFQSGGSTLGFSFVVRLFRGVFQTSPALVIGRTVTDVRFVDERTMMLVIPLPRECACDGTSCPGPGNPNCDNLNHPEVLPFDPAVAPPSTMLNGGLGPGPIMPPPPRQ